MNTISAKATPSDATKNTPGLIIPVLITVFKDRTFSFVLKSPPAAVLLRKLAGVPKGAATAGTEKVGEVTRSQLLEIARLQERFSLLRRFP